MPEKFEVCANGHCIQLTTREFRLFELFYRQPGRIYSRNQIIDQVYDDFRDLSDRTVDSHIRNLRNKLQSMGMEETIKSVYGAGYKYQPLS